MSAVLKGERMRKCLKRQNDHMITRRLTRMNLLVSGNALLLACAAFSTSRLVTYRANTVAPAGQALMISINSVPP